MEKKRGGSGETLKVLWSFGGVDAGVNILVAATKPSLQLQLERR